MKDQTTPNYDEYKQRLTNFSNEFDLGLFVHIVRKTAVWVLLCGILSVVGAVLYLRYTPEIYQAKAVIQLGEDDHSSKILNVTQIGDDNSIQARLELLRSKLLIKNTMTQIPMDVSYYAQGQILTNEHYTLSPYRVEVKTNGDESVFNRPCYVNFNNEREYRVTFKGKEWGPLAVNEWIEVNGFSLRLVIQDWKTLTENSNEYTLYFKVNGRDALASRFYKNLDVRILNNTAKTLEISFKDNNPHIARDFVMAHAEEFIRYDLERRSRSDENILQFIDDQVDTVFTRLRDSESMLNEYKQENKITDLETIGGVYLDRLSEFENQIIALEIEQRLLDEVKSIATQSTDDVEIYNLVPLIAGSEYEASLTGSFDNLYQLLLEREKALFSVTDDNTKVQNLDYQISIQKELIIETISALEEKIRERKANFEEKLQDVEDDYYTLPSKELEYARLQRLFNINEKYYTMLLAKRIEYRISKEGFVPRHQILEEALLPKAPVSPRGNIVTIAFVLAGLLLGFIIISIRYLLHNEITSLNEIVKVSNASISTLGVIPNFKEEIPVSMLIVDQHPKSLISEAFRTIRTNLQFIDNSPGPKTAAITSTISGEGKTFVALNLAGIIAFSGKRVVVLDLDMRKPKIHKGFGVDNRNGMSALLIGKSKIEECIRHSTLENLDFITAGPIPPNPSELIINNKMHEILAELKESYDMIIIDTPPVGLVTDGVEVIKQVDFPLYIFKSDYSKKQFVQVADRLINENKIKSLSVILNGIDLDRNRYSYNYKYGYGYGYGYGYSYGYGGGYYDDQPKRKRSLLSRIFKRR